MHKPIIAVVVALLTLLVATNAMAASQPLPPVDIHHIMFSPTSDGNSVEVEEVYQWKLTNAVASETISVVVPETSTELQVSGEKPEQQLDGTKLERKGNRIVTPFKWSIGQNEVRVRYKLPMVNGKALLNTQLFYFTKTLYVLAPTNDLRVGNNQLEDLGQQLMDSREYHIFGGGDIPSGVGLEFNISVAGQPAGEAKVSKVSPVGRIDFHSPEHLSRWNSSPLRATNPHVWVVFMVLVVVGFSVALVYYFRLRTKRIKLRKYDDMYDTLQARQNRLFEKLVGVEERLSRTPEDLELQELKATYWRLLREIRIKQKTLEAERD